MMFKHLLLGATLLVVQANVAQAMTISDVSGIFADATTAFKTTVMDVVEARRNRRAANRRQEDACVTCVTECTAGNEETRCEPCTSKTCFETCAGIYGEDAVNGYVQGGCDSGGDDGRDHGKDIIPCSMCMNGCGGEDSDECHNADHSDGDLGICDCDGDCDEIENYQGNHEQRCERTHHNDDPRPAEFLACQENAGCPAGECPFYATDAFDGDRWTTDFGFVVDVLGTDECVRSEVACICTAECDISWWLGGGGPAVCDYVGGDKSDNDNSGSDKGYEEKPVCDARGVGSGATPSAVPFKSDFTELFEHNCNGELSILGGHELFKMRMGMSNMQNTLGGVVVDHLKTRIDQLCPGARADPEVGMGVEPSITAAFATILAGSTEAEAEWKRAKVASYCAKGAGQAIEPPTFFDLASLFSVVLPSTCDPTKYAANGCKVQYTFTEAVFGGLALQFAMKECPGKVAPYFAVSCDGHMCQDFLKPCNADTDCKGSVCSSVKAVMDDLGAFGGDDDGDETFEDKMESLATIAQYGAEQTGLVKADEKGCAGTTVGDDVASVFMNGFNSLYTSGASPTNDFKMCGLGDVGTVLDCAFNAKFPDPFESCTFEDGKLPCDEDNMKSWDGKLADGSDVFSASRMSPTPLGSVPASCSTNSAKSVPLIHSKCDGTNTFSPGSPFAPSMQLPLAHAALSKLITPAFEAIVKAGNECTAATPREEGLFWDIYRPPMWMQMLTTNNERIERTDEAQGTIYEMIHQGMFEACHSNTEDDTMAQQWGMNCDTFYNDDEPEKNNHMDRMEMPAGCTLADYLTTGECKLQWTGLGKVLSSHPVTIRATISDCPGSYPSLYVDCVDDKNGDACRDLIRIYDVTTCTKDSDCTFGECTIVGDDIAGILDTPVDPVTQLMFGALGEGDCAGDFQCCSGNNDQFGTGAYSWDDNFFNEEDGKTCFRPYDAHEIENHGGQAQPWMSGAACLDRSDSNGKAWDCQAWGTAGDVATFEDMVLDLVGKVAGTSAKEWKPGSKGICIPTVNEELDMDSMISTKRGVKSYMYGAEIVELTDMEPYQAVAGDSCVSDVVQAENELKQELMTTLLADLGIAPDEPLLSAASRDLVNAAVVATALLFAALV